MSVHRQQGLSKSILYEIMALFRHPPSKGLEFLARVECHKVSKKHSLNVMEMIGLNQDKHMQCINETKFGINI